jgi:hypothetical protein
MISLILHTKESRRNFLLSNTADSFHRFILIISLLRGAETDGDIRWNSDVIPPTELSGGWVSASKSALCSCVYVVLYKAQWYVTCSLAPQTAAFCLRSTFRRLARFVQYQPTRLMEICRILRETRIKSSHKTGIKVKGGRGLSKLCIFNLGHRRR